MVTLVLAVNFLSLMDDLSLCATIAALGSPLAFIASIASHILYFIRGERNKEAGQIVQWSIASFNLLVLILFSVCSFDWAAIWAALTLTTTFGSGLALSIGSYRLLFHSTRKYPGRKLEALTKWLAAIVARRTQRYHAYLQSLHGDFGDIVRTGPQEISINKVDAVKAIYDRDSLCLKGPWYDLGGTGLNLHRTRDPNLHERQRPLWEKSFRG